jgi:hypothetical protein
MAERRIDLNYPCVCYNCSYMMEYIISATASYAVYVATLWYKKDNQIYCSAVLMIIPIYSLVNSNLKRTYVNENLEILTLSLKMLRISLGALIIIKKLLNIPNLNEDLLLVIAITISAVIAAYIVTYSDKKTIKNMYELWIKKPLNNQSLIDIMLFIHRAISQKESTRKGQIIYEGYFLLHAYNCTEPYCFISKLLRRANIDISAVAFSNLATFISRNSKHLNKLVSTIYYKTAKQ